MNHKKRVNCSSGANADGNLSYTQVPGLAGGVGPQLFNGHQHRVAVSVGEGRPLPEKLGEPLSLAQVDLQEIKKS